MANATACQTPNAVYSIRIGPQDVQVSVSLPRPLDLNEERAALLEANLHNAVELCLAPHFLAITKEPKS